MRQNYRQLLHFRRKLHISSRRLTAVPHIVDVDGSLINSYSLRYKIEQLLASDDPTEAEDVLKRSVLEGRTVSWNLLISYYAKLGKYSESERIYRLVTDPSSAEGEANLDEKMWCPTKRRHVRSISAQFKHSESKSEERHYPKRTTQSWDF